YGPCCVRAVAWGVGAASQGEEVCLVGSAATLGSARADGFGLFTRRLCVPDDRCCRPFRQRPLRRRVHRYRERRRRLRRWICLGPRQPWRVRERTTQGFSLGDFVCRMIAVAVLFDSARCVVVCIGIVSAAAGCAGGFVWSAATLAERPGGGLGVFTPWKIFTNGFSVLSSAGAWRPR